MQIDIAEGMMSYCFLALTAPPTNTNFTNRSMAMTTGTFVQQGSGSRYTR